jgi:hypothetical protein
MIWLHAQQERDLVMVVVVVGGGGGQWQISRRARQAPGMRRTQSYVVSCRAARGCGRRRRRLQPPLQQRPRRGAPSAWCRLMPAPLAQSIGISSHTSTTQRHAAQRVPQPQRSAVPPHNHPRAAHLGLRSRHLLLGCLQLCSRGLGLQRQRAKPLSQAARVVRSCRGGGRLPPGFCCRAGGEAVPQEGPPALPALHQLGVLLE